MLKHCFFLLPPLGWLICMLLTKYFSRRLHRGQKLLQRLGWSSSASARSPSPHRGHGSVAGLYQWTPATRFWMSCIWAPLTYPLSRYYCSIAFFGCFYTYWWHHGISKSWEHWYSAGSQYLISLVKVEDRRLPPWIRKLSDVPAQVRLPTAATWGPPWQPIASAIIFVLLVKDWKKENQPSFFPTPILTWGGRRLCPLARATRRRQRRRSRCALMAAIGRTAPIQTTPAAHRRPPVLSVRHYLPWTLLSSNKRIIFKLAMNWTMQNAYNY